MRIGIDFDNTLVDYDRVFVAAAKRQGLIPLDFTGTKQAVRDCIRRSSDGELAWQRLQGHVYGAGIGDATLFDGAGDFLGVCRTRGLEVFVVSHKTQFGHHDPTHVDLRRAALGWMKARGFFRPDGFAIAPAHVFFESTRAEKLARIRAAGCDVFIDDLVEVFADPGFPAEVRPILFAATATLAGVAVCPTWRQVAETVFGGPA